MCNSRDSGIQKTLDNIRFDGSDYDPGYDDIRLTGQLLRIYHLMKDGDWFTLTEIEVETGDPQASISAQLRHLRKERFGSNKVEKRRVKGKEKTGLFEYRLEINPNCNLYEGDGEK